MANVLYIKSDRNLIWDGAKDEGTGEYLNSATVTWALKTAPGGTTLGTGTLTIQDAFGTYLGIIDQAVTALLTAGVSYVLEITFLQGNYDDFRRIGVVAAYRRNN